MTRLATLALACFVPCLACGGDDADTGADTTGHDHDHDMSTSSASTTASTSSASTTASTTDTTTASTTASSSDTDGTGSESGGGSTGADGSGSDTTGGHAELDAAWCECMLNNCHDLYHGTWGEDHMASEAMCLEAAAAVPGAGSDVSEGNFIECRLHFCEQAASDEALCENAIGNAVCI